MLICLVDFNFDHRYTVISHTSNLQIEKERGQIQILVIYFIKKYQLFIQVVWGVNTADEVFVRVGLNKEIT